MKLTIPAEKIDCSSFQGWNKEVKDTQGKLLLPQSKVMKYVSFNPKSHDITIKTLNIFEKFLSFIGLFGYGKYQEKNYLQSLRATNILKTHDQIPKKNLAITIDNAWKDFLQELQGDSPEETHHSKNQEDPYSHFADDQFYVELKEVLSKDQKACIKHFTRLCSLKGMEANSTTDYKAYYRALLLKVFPKGKIELPLNFAQRRDSDDTKLSLLEQFFFRENNDKALSEAFKELIPDEHKRTLCLLGLTWNANLTDDLFPRWNSLLGGPKKPEHAKLQELILDPDTYSESLSESLASYADLNYQKIQNLFNQSISAEEIETAISTLLKQLKTDTDEDTSSLSKENHLKVLELLIDNIQYIPLRHDWGNRAEYNINPTTYTRFSDNFDLPTVVYQHLVSTHSKDMRTCYVQAAELIFKKARFKNESNLTNDQLSKKIVKNFKEQKVTLSKNFLAGAAAE